MMEPYLKTLYGLDENNKPYVKERYELHTTEETYLKLHATDTKFNSVKMLFNQVCMLGVKPSFSCSYRPYYSFEEMKSQSERRSNQKFDTYEEALAEYDSMLSEINDIENRFCEEFRDRWYIVEEYMGYSFDDLEIRIRPDIREWLADRPHTLEVNRVIGHYVLFENKHTAFEFKMRWG